MDLKRLLVRTVAPVVNVPVAVLASSRFHRFTRNTTVLTYVGRRSGRTFSIPVAYRRVGDDVVVPVGMPEAKTWFRNFLGDGGPLTLRLDGADRSGHGVARRDEQGGVTVTVRLNET